MRSDLTPSIQTVISQVELLANNWQHGDLRPISIHIFGREDAVQFGLSWLRDQVIECEVEQFSGSRMSRSNGRVKVDLLSCVATKMLEVCGGDRHGEIIVMPQRGARLSNGEVRFCVTVKTTHYVVHPISVQMMNKQSFL
jgi:hypothetical protein